MSGTTPPPREGGAGPAVGLTRRHGARHHLRQFSLRRFSALELAVALVVLVVIANLLISLARSGSTPDSPGRISQAVVTAAPAPAPAPSQAIPSEDQSAQAETVSGRPAGAGPNHPAVAD